MRYGMAFGLGLGMALWAVAAPASAQETAVCGEIRQTIARLQSDIARHRLDGLGGEEVLRGMLADQNRSIARLTSQSPRNEALLQQQRARRSQTIAQLETLMARRQSVQDGEAMIRRLTARAQDNDCDRPPETNVRADYAEWMTGTFNSSFGTMKLTPGSGSYDQYGGRIIVMRISGATMEGRWTQTSSGGQCPDGTHGGRFVFHFTGAGFTGSWGYCDAEPTRGGWNGTRMR